MLKSHLQNEANKKLSAFRPKFLLSEIFSLRDDKTIANTGKLVSITTKGFIFHLEKKHLPVTDNAYWEGLINQPIGFVLSEFEVELHGVVRDLHLADKDILEVYASYLDKTPFFYKQCVVALLH